MTVKIICTSNVMLTDDVHELGMKKNKNKTQTMSVKIIYFESLEKPKKLAGTKWGASSKILKQVYVGNVRPVLAFASIA